jgi:predicted TIM-barrel fold metal-dependent hydrolase
VINKIKQKTSSDFILSIKINSKVQTNQIVSKIKMFRAIDVWAQHSEDFVEKVPETQRLGKLSKSDPSVYSKSPKELVGMMDEAGVEKVFLSAWNRPGKVIISNEKVYSYVSEFPDRFYGLASVDLENPVLAVKELEKCVKEYGFIVKYRLLKNRD